MIDVLTRWNGLSLDQAGKEILPCCGSQAWAEGMAKRRPVPDATSLLAVSDDVWRSLSQADWMEAFLSHPRIGESRAVKAAPGQSSAWSRQEQQTVTTAGDAVKATLAEANLEYEHRFGHIFIVCATGKSGREILEILRRRLQNDKATELREAAEQQRQIAQIRLKKWLSE
jgi:2-oxo-4-hydroxy-4-carboxy-5-ureidoimidazoline decarboxylase